MESGKKKVVMERSKKPLYGVIILFIVGGILGAKYLSLFFNEDILPGIVFGCIIAFGLSFVFSKEFRKSSTISKVKKYPNNLPKAIWTYFSHPVNRPMSYAVLWFFGSYIFITTFFPGIANSTEHSVEFTFAIIIPALILLGLSGYRMLKQGKYITLFYTYRDSRAYFHGIFLLVIGWGGALYWFVYLITGL